MKEIKKSVTINAPASKIFDYLTDPNNLLEIWPSMIEVSNVKRSPDGSHNFDFVYKMAGMRFNGHSETVKVTQNKYVELENKTGIKSHFKWTYDGRDGATEITLQVSYEVPSQLLAKLAEPFLVKINEREADTLLHNLRERMEATDIGAKPTGPGKEKRA
ncbi:MAG: bacterio-opsin linked product [Myxococcaceae bacterium]|nr:bacterio-opsin linked product [Myxococcaceae bacterium]